MTKLTLTGILGAFQRLPVLDRKILEEIPGNSGTRPDEGEWKIVDGIDLIEVAERALVSIYPGVLERFDVLGQIKNSRIANSLVFASPQYGSEGAERRVVWVRTPGEGTRYPTGYTNLGD